MSPQNGPTMPSSAFGASFYDDSNTAPSQLSAGMRPKSAHTATDPEPEAHNDERRPSIASITTASSSGSRGSVVRSGIHKKLQGFFGDEYSGKDASETSLSSQTVGKEQRSGSYSRHRDRKASTTTDARDSSPAPSRPRSPVPSSEVVPFLYQDSQVSTSRFSQYDTPPTRTNNRLGYLQIRRGTCA